MPANAPCLSAYPSSSSFLRAVVRFDNWHMNMALGPTVHLIRVGDSEAKGVWLSVWTEEELDIVLVRSIPNLVVLASPRHSFSMEADWLAPRMALLVDELSRLITTGSAAPLAEVFGPEILADAFSSRWDTISGRLNTPKVGLTTFLSHVPASYFESLEGPNLPAGHEIYKAAADEDPETLVELFEAFAGRHVPSATSTLDRVKEGIRWKEIFVYTLETETGEEVAGYVRTGRPTLRHAAIRNVFTLPKYRKRGIAEALTRAAVLDLLTTPSVVETELAGITSEKAEVVDVIIFAERSNPSAQAIYGRVGFGFPCAAREEEDGKSWEPCVDLHYAASD